MIYVESANLIQFTMPTKEDFLERIDELIDYGRNLSGSDSENLLAWETSCCNLIEKAFGKESDYYTNIRGVAFAYGNRTAHVSHGIAILESAKRDLQQGLDTTREVRTTGSAFGALLFLEQLCSRFHLIARQLRSRYEQRPTLDVTDEYDVQDLMHALLRINFDDIRPEEWTPSYAGGSSRMDFLLKNEAIVVETKKTRVGLSPRKLGEELIVDTDKYRTHPDCRTLFCFVYDPDGRVSNPSALESDLSRTEGEMTVKVLVSPKGF